MSDAERCCVFDNRTSGKVIEIAFDDFTMQEIAVLEF